MVLLRPVCCGGHLELAQLQRVISFANSRWFTFEYIHRAQTVGGDKYGVGLIPGGKQTEAEGWNQTPREKEKVKFMSRLLKRNGLKIVGTKIRSRCGGGNQVMRSELYREMFCNRSTNFVVNKVEIYLLTRFMKTLRSPSYRNPKHDFIHVEIVLKA